MKRESIFYLLGVCGFFVFLSSGCRQPASLRPGSPEATAKMEIKTAEIERTLRVIDMETAGIVAVPTAQAKKRLVSLTGINVAGNITLDQDIGGSPFGDVTKDAVKKIVDQLVEDNKLPEKMSVAVVAFDNKSPLRARGDIGWGTAELLIAELVDRGKWVVLDREMLQAAMQEQGISDLTDPNISVDLRLKVAQFLIKGTITNAWVGVRDTIKPPPRPK